MFFFSFWGVDLSFFGGASLSFWRCNFVVVFNIFMLLLLFFYVIVFVFGVHLCCCFGCEFAFVQVYYIGGAVFEVLMWCFRGCRFFLYFM